MIELIVIVSLFCNGLYIVSRPGKLFDFADNNLQSFMLGHIWFAGFYKPILGCVRCMASLWGIALSLLMLPMDWSILWRIPIICISASALNAILFELYE